MNKGVAIPYLIAIIFGVLILGLIGYWFFKTNTQLKCSDCDRLRAEFCGKWAIDGYSGNGPKGGWDSYAPGCNDVCGINVASSTDCK